jgi:hypothetical protein
MRICEVTRRWITAGLLATSIASCRHAAVSPAVSANGGIAAATLRRNLLVRRDSDQAVRRVLIERQRRGSPIDSLVIARVHFVDSVNTAWLKAVVATHGWPGRTLVGLDGANAAFLLVQHADRDTAFQAQVLPLLENAYAHGEAEGQAVALLADRLAVARGQEQLYGSQTELVGGHIVVKSIADSAHVDQRRARVGLPPLTVYLQLLDSVYARRPSP